MNANKPGLVLLLAASTIVHAQPTAGSKTTGAVAASAPTTAHLTIGELSAQARQKRIADETKPVVPAVPAGMMIVPSTEIVTTGANASSKDNAPPKKVKPVPPPEVVPGLLAIAKDPNGVRFAELADTTGPNKYTVGQSTPSGWRIVAVGTHYIELSKPAANKKPARSLILSLTNQ